MYVVFVKRDDGSLHATIEIFLRFQVALFLSCGAHGVIDPEFIEPLLGLNGQISLYSAIF